MRKVFEHIDSARVGHYQSILESRGIQTLIKNSGASSLMGEIPFTEVFPELWVVNDADEQNAAALIQEYRHSAPSGAKDWVCRRCGADVPAELSECWKCGTNQADSGSRDHGIPSPQMERSENRDGIPVAVFIAAGVVLALLAFASQGNLKVKQPGKSGSTEQTFEYDNNGDGRSDRFYIYKDGALLRGHGDRNADGRVDMWEHYDSTGKPERASSDENFDGEPDMWLVYSDGEMGTVTRDADFNGLVDWTTTYRNGVPVESICIPNASGHVTVREVYEHGVLREQWIDDDRDGNFDRMILHDPFGKQTEQRLEE